MRNMKTKKIIEIWMFFVAVLIALAIGGDFVDGKYFDTTILGIIPNFIHILVGWTIIISVIIGFGYKLIK
jgi:hypothetical protein